VCYVYIIFDSQTKSLFERLKVFISLIGGLLDAQIKAVFISSATWLIGLLGRLNVFAPNIDDCGRLI